MPRLLVINPNTSQGVSLLLQQHVGAALGGAIDIEVVTARFGAPYIACEASYAVAQHAALDAFAAAHAQPGPQADAVLIGCFGDPGLFALQAGAGLPVSGLAQAAFDEAATHGRFAIVTGGERWRPMLERLAHALGHERALAGIHAVAPSGAQLAADPVGARALLATACQEAADRFAPDAIILGGAGLAGMAADIAPRLSLPLVDSVEAGARWALSAIRRQREAPSAAARNAGFGVAWQHVSWELEALP